MQRNQIKPATITPNKTARVEIPNPSRLASLEIVGLKLEFGNGVPVNAFVRVGLGGGVIKEVTRVSSGRVMIEVMIGGGGFWTGGAFGFGFWGTGGGKGGRFWAGGAFGFCGRAFGGSFCGEPGRCTVVSPGGGVGCVPVGTEFLNTSGGREVATLWSKVGLVAGLLTVGTSVVVGPCAGPVVPRPWTGGAVGSLTGGAIGLSLVGEASGSRVGEGGASI